MRMIHECGRSMQHHSYPVHWNAAPGAVNALRCLGDSSIMLVSAPSRNSRQCAMHFIVTLVILAASVSRLVYL